MDQWPLDDGLAQTDEDEEHDKVEHADDGKGSRQASYGVGERIGRRKGEIDDGDDQQYSKHCDKHQHRQQPHNLVYYIELHIFRLKPDVMLDHLDQLRYGLNILIV